MKLRYIKQTFFLSIFTMVAISSFAQYERIAREGRVWYTEVNSTFLGTTTKVLAVQGDTVINGNIYPFLVRKDSSLNTLEKLGFFIEDTVAGTLIIDYLNAATPDSYYDMSVVKGDTITYASLMGGNSYALVDSIYTITDLQNIVRKAIILAPLEPDSCVSSWQQIWIEGIGSTGLLISPLPECKLVTEVNYNLTCVWDGNDQIYGTAGQCYLLSEHEEELNSLAIYPNPTKGVIHVDAMNIQRITLLDLAGRELMYIEGKSFLDLSEFGQGTYILYVQDDEGTVVRKIVKQ